MVSRAGVDPLCPGEWPSLADVNRRAGQHWVRPNARRFVRATRADPDDHTATRPARRVERQARSPSTDRKAEGKNPQAEPVTAHQRQEGTGSRPQDLDSEKPERLALSEDTLRYGPAGSRDRRCQITLCRDEGIDLQRRSSRFQPRPKDRRPGAGSARLAQRMVYSGDVVDEGERNQREGNMQHELTHRDGGIGGPIRSATRRETASTPGEIAAQPLPP